MEEAYTAAIVGCSSRPPTEWRALDAEAGPEGGEGGSNPGQILNPKFSNN